MKAKEVKKILGITAVTLCTYIKQGKIRYIKINTNHYIYNDEDVYKLIGVKKEKHDRINVSYARITNQSINDLKEQSNRIYDFSIRNGICIDKQFEDIKSGMSFDRNNFKELLKLIIEGKVELIIIENKDRLCRFGFELMTELFKYYGTKIIVINENIQNKSHEQEIKEDIINVIEVLGNSILSKNQITKIKREILEIN